MGRTIRWINLLLVPLLALACVSGDALEQARSDLEAHRRFRDEAEDKLWARIRALEAESRAWKCVNELYQRPNDRRAFIDEWHELQIDYSKPDPIMNRSAASLPKTAAEAEQTKSYARWLNNAIRGYC